MKEVVRQEANHLCEHGNYHCSICEIKLLEMTVDELLEANRLLIEERGRDKAALSEKDAIIEALEVAKEYEIECHTNSCLEYQEQIFKFTDKATEQDKEIQRLQETNKDWSRHYDNLLERKRRLEKYVPEDQWVVLDKKD